jgi:hypothetical protein
MQFPAFPSNAPQGQLSLFEAFMVPPSKGLFPAKEPSATWTLEQPDRFEPEVFSEICWPPCSANSVKSWTPAG